MVRVLLAVSVEVNKTLTTEKNKLKKFFFLSLISKYRAELAGWQVGCGLLRGLWVCYPSI